jgi:hypothetical protein
MNHTSPIPDVEWEKMWAPYDEPTYAAVLEAIDADDVVLEIGAGDLRLAKQMASKARQVYAVEQNEALLEGVKNNCPANCYIIRRDARLIPFPTEITAAVLLMRHCLSFKWYWNKLADTRCRKLITNARWGMGVEIIDTAQARVPFEAVPIGWYACRCGGAGFVPGAAELVTDQLLKAVWEVDGCPACSGVKIASACVRAASRAH